MKGRTPLILLGRALLPCLLSGLASGQDEGVDLRKLRSICLPAEPNRREQEIATVLQRKLRDRYQINLRVTKGEAPKGEPAILVGRELALASQMITSGDLEAVKHDGYVLKVEGRGIALAGYRGLGTLYAGYALLRRVGLAFLPRGSGTIERLTPMKETVLPPFSISDKPFFEYRALGMLRGPFGSSWQDMGTPRSAEPKLFEPNLTKDWNDWTGGDHTSAYLVPKKIYHDEHPEYYALRNGKRIPKSIASTRLNLCLSNPDVRRITIERAVRWVGLESDRRFFTINDADSRYCECAACGAMDAKPNHLADRLLKWVNPAAEAVRAQYPDRIIFTLAYCQTAKPPLLLKPAPNVWVQYCPWYWSSRGTPGDHGFDHPRNIVAMEEFIGWCRWCPGQVALYEYPSGSRLFLYAQAKRLKFYAKHGVRGIYYCGRPKMWEDIFLYVMSRLDWDPFLDVGELEDEFCEGYYGPAAPAMREFFALERRASRAFGHGYVGDEMYLRDGLKLLERAEELVRDEEPLLLRLYQDLVPWHERHLTTVRPAGPLVKGDKGFELFRAAVAGHVRRLFRCADLRERAGDTRTATTMRKEIHKTLGRFGLVLLPQTEAADDLDDLLEEEEDDPWADLEKRIVPMDAVSKVPGAEPGEKVAAPGAEPEPDKQQESPPGVVQFLFDSEEAAEGCETDSTQADLIVPPKIVSVKALPGTERRGVRIAAPLSQLPTVKLPLDPKGIATVHAGRFFFQKRFEPPLATPGLTIFEFHLHASCEVPATLYVDIGTEGNGLRADVNLHAGEQIVRVDARNRQRGAWEHRSWVKDLRGVMIDLWPQDNFHPFPETRDAEVVLFGLTARSEDPLPGDLPHKGQAIWLTQHRSNVTHQFCVKQTELKRTKQKGPSIEYAQYSPEAFRTFTRHRALTPVFGIFTSPTAPDPEREAAEAMRGYLEKLFGVELPVNPPGMTIDRDSGNAVILGKDAGLGSGRVEPGEVDYVGEQGFVLRATDGRIVIAGADAAGTGFGVARYLEDHGVWFFVPDRGEAMLSLKESFLHELVVFDWPYFKSRPVPGGWRLMTQTDEERVTDPGVHFEDDQEALFTMAKAIKQCAREKREIPADLAKRASCCARARYVAAKLLWDPFRNTSELIDEFRCRSGAPWPLGKER